MKKYFKIINHAWVYPSKVWLFITFNISTALFGIFSISLVAPFLKVIFKSKAEMLKSVESAKDIEFSFNQINKIGDYYISKLILDFGQYKALLLFSGLIILMFFLKNLSLWLSFSQIAFLRSALVRDIKKKLYHKILELPIGYYTSEKKGDIMSRMSNDIGWIEWAMIGGLEMLFKHPINIIFTLIALSLISWKLTLFVLILLPISGFFISRLAKKLRGVSKLGQEKLADILSMIEESISGIKIIKGFTAEDNRKQLYDYKNDQHFELMVKLHKRELMASPLSEFLGSIVLSCIMVFGGSLILGSSSSMSPDFFITFIALFSQIIPPAKALSENVFRLQKGYACFERVEEIYNTPNHINEPQSPIILSKFEQQIEFKNVNFNFGDKPILKNINLKIEKGTSVALVGSSGGGKSTLVDLIPRFHDILSGQLMIDQIDVNQYDIKSLRKNIGIVTQESILFNDSIANNISFGIEHADRTLIEQAAEIANASEFIKQMEHGFDTNIGERGGKLSGGQKQRIAIARAVLKNPPILILDEATSALDTESEKLVQEALFNLMKNRTSIIIAHRLSTIQNADKIIVIDNGCIVESGNHHDLIQKQGIYKKLIDMQSF